MQRHINTSTDVSNTVGGDVDRGLAGYLLASQLSPRALDSYANISGIGYAHFFQHDFRLAIDWPPIHWMLAAAYALLDRMDEAHESIAALHAIAPQITLGDIQRIARRGRFDPVVEGLRKAGLSELRPDRYP